MDAHPHMDAHTDSDAYTAAAAALPNEDALPLPHAHVDRRADGNSAHAHTTADTYHHPHIYAPGKRTHATNRRRDRSCVTATTTARSCLQLELAHAHLDARVDTNMDANMDARCYGNTRNAGQHGSGSRLRRAIRRACHI